MQLPEKLWNLAGEAVFPNPRLLNHRFHIFLGYRGAKIPLTCPQKQVVNAQRREEGPAYFGLPVVGKGVSPSAQKPWQPAPSDRWQLSTFAPPLHPIPTLKPHLREHDQPEEEGGDRHSKDEDLPPILLTKHMWVHVHQRRHQALYAHKLDERAKELEGKRAAKISSINSLWLMAPRVSDASLPRLKSPELSLQVRSGPTLQSSSWSLEGHPHLTFAQSPTVLRSLRVSSPLLPLPQLTNAHHLLASVWPPLDTWLSSPRRTTMKKKQQAQRGEKGSITTARG